MNKNTDECATCLRWWECNGEDQEFCPVVNGTPKSKED